MPLVWFLIKSVCVSNISLVATSMRKYVSYLRYIIDIYLFSCDATCLCDLIILSIQTYELCSVAIAVRHLTSKFQKVKNHQRPTRFKLIVFLFRVSESQVSKQKLKTRLLLCHMCKRRWKKFLLQEWTNRFATHWFFGNPEIATEVHWDSKFGQLADRARTGLDPSPSARAQCWAGTT